MTNDVIDFSKLKPRQFEELCYDLLLNYGFHSLKWRQGGADMGRDIEAQKANSDGFVNPYTETWFVECKNHRDGLSVGDISDKFDWANAERANHLLLMTASYLTQTATTWTEKRASSDHFRLHVLDGKALKVLLFKHPDLVEKYFPNDANQLVKELFRHWLTHGVAPHPRALCNMYGNWDLESMGREELAFLWYAYASSQEEIETYCEENDLELPYDLTRLPCPPVIPHLKKFASSPYPIYGNVLPDRDINQHVVGVSYATINNGQTHSAMVHKRISKTEQLQAVLTYEDKVLQVYIALGPFPYTPPKPK